MSSRGKKRPKGIQRKQLNIDTKNKVSSSNKDVKLCFWNIAGLINKDAEFFQFISEFAFVGMVETWVESKDWDKIKNKLPKGFKWECQGAIRKSKHGRACGGIITGIKNELIGNKETAECEGVVKRSMHIESEWSVVTAYNRGAGTRNFMEK